MTDMVHINEPRLGSRHQMMKMYVSSEYPSNFVHPTLQVENHFHSSFVEPDLPSTSIEETSKINEFEDISVDDKLYCLSGLFQVLSHCYATPMFIHRKRYRSVEHYVCQKFFKSLNFNTKAVEKLVTTTDPRKLSAIVAKILSTQYPPIPNEVIKEKRSKMAKWYEIAMKKKFDSFPILRQILLATGNALLIETNNIDDKIMSVGVSEAEIQFLLTKPDVTPQLLLRYMSDPDSKTYKFRRIGRNRTGLMLMTLRQHLNHTGERFSPVFEGTPMVSSLDYASDSMVCFTCQSVLHPKFLSPIFNFEDSILYPSVDHYLYAEGAKFLCFPQSSIQRLMDESHDTVRWRFAEEIWNRFPDPSKLHEWWSRHYDEILKSGCRMKFETHPELLRVLLETSDSLLVYCHRFSTANSEWSIGMRESELREWKNYNRFSNGALIDLILDTDKRPAFLGGNRLGFILMELRREFRLKGQTSYSLPMLTDNTNNEIIFGEATGLETGDEYDSNWTPSKFLLWPSPMVLQCKSRGFSVWYPGKRRLTGYYDEGFAPDPKRNRDHNQQQCQQFIHPEYVFPTPVSKVYSLSPEILNFTSAPEALKPFVVLLIRNILQSRADINQQNEILERMLDDIQYRNNFQIVEHEESDEEIEQKPRSPRTSSSDFSYIYPRNPGLYSKIKSLEAGFVSILSSKRNEGASSTIDDINFHYSDEQRMKNIIDRFYGNLNGSERVNAMNWLKNILEKMNRFKFQSSTSLNSSDDSLNTFVPYAKRKNIFSVPKIFENDDTNDIG